MDTFTILSAVDYSNRIANIGKCVYEDVYEREWANMMPQVDDNEEEEKIMSTSKSKIIKQLKQLDIVTLNLKIEAARLKEPNAISVVADNIEKAIIEIEKEIEEIE